MINIVYTLAYTHAGATKGSVCSSPPTPPHFINPACIGPERSLLECALTSRETLCPKLFCTGDNLAYGAVTCIKGEFNFLPSKSLHVFHKVSLTRLYQRNRKTSGWLQPQ